MSYMNAQIAADSALSIVDIAIENAPRSRATNASWCSGCLLENSKSTNFVKSVTPENPIFREIALPSRSSKKQMIGASSA
jgi:hypothetical protein